jgi:hypothetical protein
MCSFLLCFHSRQRFFCCTHILGFRRETPEYVWKSPRGEIIEVLTLPLCPSYFNIMYPNFNGDIIITGSLLLQLTLRWPNFRLINVSTDRTINFPAKISITPFQAYRLRAILEESYCAHILILHHDIKSPILPTPDKAISMPSALPWDM